ncbi:unnamed protein product [Anisakis simplex]|uniref:Myosin tail domain-containing protein n=1 Tax=Anisakis simplex TaxID=6269 RepID=A0A0M3J4H0_ANISI|nr:unnamed protein product [Anisakis simplex]
MIKCKKNTNSANENELERLRKKVTQLTDINKQQALELENIRNERDQLDRAYRDKVKQVEQLSDAVKNLQAKLTYSRQELHDVKEKASS